MEEEDSYELLLEGIDRNWLRRRRAKPNRYSIAGMDLLTIAFSNADYASVERRL
ncbi:MAG: hypothetical protein ACLRNW_11570 [Neglectibacter sp.]